MLTWAEMDVMLKKNLSLYREKVANMIRRKFYDTEYKISIGYERISEEDVLTIELHNEKIKLNLSEYSNKHVDFNAVSFVNLRRIFYDIRRDEYCNFTTGVRSYTIHNNYIVTDVEISQYNDFYTRHKDLMFLMSVAKYMYKYLNLCKTTHYLAHLDRAYTLLLINKQQKIFPHDILKIIIAKLF